MKFRLLKVSALVAVVGLSSFAYGGTVAPLPNYATNSDIALMVLANYERAKPENQHLNPYVWNDKLFAAAKAHGIDEVTNNCYQHDSCNGTHWGTRVGSYYTSWYALGENIISGGSNPQAMHDSWMASPGHKANILNGTFLEMGAAIVGSLYPDGSQWLYGTQDFGARTTVTIPYIPGGAVINRVDFSTSDRKYLVNYFDKTDKAPQSVSLVIGNQKYPMVLANGNVDPAQGTYTVTGKFLPVDACTPFHFEAVTASGQQVVYPEGYSINALNVSTYSSYNQLIGNCPDRTSSPVPAPTPTPVATPTPTPVPAPTPAPTAGTSTLQISNSVNLVNQGKTYQVILEFQCLNSGAPVGGCKFDFEVTKLSGASTKRPIFRTLKTNKLGKSRIVLNYNLKSDGGSSFKFKVLRATDSLNSPVTLAGTSELNILVP